MKLTAETIEKLKSANMANLVRKIGAGKTLTAAESKLIEAASATAHDKELVTTSRLAEIFGINRKTLGEWRRVNREDIPAKIDDKEDLAAWRSWFAANPDAGFADKKPRADRETLLCEKLTIEIAIKRIELDESIGSVISSSDVEEGMAAIGSVMKSTLQRMENDCPPRLEGLTANEIKKELRSQHEKIYATFRDELRRIGAVDGKPRHHWLSEKLPTADPPQPVAVGGKARPDAKLVKVRKVRNKRNPVAAGTA
jgi:hypothetical protein